MEYGYVRVSTKEQNEMRQLVAMKEFGILDENLFLDKQSGKDFSRPAYQKLVKRLGEKDTIIIKSIDRLGRNYDEILEQWRIITKEKRASIVVLDMPLLDTRDENRDLTGIFVADLVLQILCYVAQSERENIRQRQAEGIAVAKVNGVRFGRPKSERPANFSEICCLYLNQEITATDAAATLNISRTTFSRWYKNEFSNEIT
ncbi:MAG: recombinase family protein [Eubacteriales bacterium]